MVMMGKWGSPIERTNTWWEPGAAAWTAYLSRCRYLLQQGLYVADYARFIGETPRPDADGGVIDEAFFGMEIQEGGPSAYWINADAIMNRIRVKDGLLVLPDGMNYRLLVLPSEAPWGRKADFLPPGGPLPMTPRLLRRLKELVEGGATVIGPRPESSPSLDGYPQCDEEVRSLAAEMWGDCDGRKIMEHKLGKGRVIWGRTPEQVLAADGVNPDCDIAAAGRGKAYIHRRTGDADIYLVVSQREPSEVDCTFRVSGREPELWHPDTGTIEKAPVWRESDGRTTVRLRFDPAGSVFVIFRKAPQAADRAVSAKFVPRAVPSMQSKAPGAGLHSERHRAESLVRFRGPALRRVQERSDDPFRSEAPVPRRRPLSHRLLPAAPRFLPEDIPGRIAPPCRDAGAAFRRQRLPPDMPGYKFRFRDAAVPRYLQPEHARPGVLVQDDHHGADDALHAELRDALGGP